MPTRALFAGLIGERFALADDTLVLMAVTPLANGAGFALVLTGDPAIVLAQQTHLVRHPALGEHPIFLGPIARNERATTYEAVFA